jgi:hypothetical protein
VAPGDVLASLPHATFTANKGDSMKRREISPEEMVTRAALFLDRRYGRWADRVNIETLNMMDTTLCVSGQVFGPRTWEQTSKAFQEELGITDEEDQGVFSCHDDLWVAQVLARQEFQTFPDLQVIGEQIADGYTEGDGWKLELS